MKEELDEYECEPVIMRIVFAQMFDQIQIKNEKHLFVIHFQ